MKRLLLVLLVAAFPVAVSAFDTHREVRVGVLRGLHAEQDDVARVLREELRERGFEAFDAMRTYDEAREDGAPVADFYVEVTAAHMSESEYAGVGVGTRHAGVSVGVRVARLAGELRIYDGESMKLVSSHQLAKRNTAIVPTSIGLGGGALYAYIALPFVERAQVRRVVRAAGESAAEIVADAIAAE